MIVRCTKLRTRNGDAPKAYVGYKLFGYENVVTDVAEEGTDPTFDSEQALPIQINGQFMRTLRKEHLEMTVFDDLTRADGEPIGAASILWRHLPKGNLLSGRLIYDLPAVHSAGSCSSIYAGESRYKLGTLAPSVTIDRWIQKKFVRLNAVSKPVEKMDTAMET